MNEDDKALEFKHAHITGKAMRDHWGPIVDRIAAETADWRDEWIYDLITENERLREALNDALSHCYNCGGDPHYIEEDEVTGDHLWTDCPVCRSARAALGETK